MHATKECLGSQPILTQRAWQLNGKLRIPYPEINVDLLQVAQKACSNQFPSFAKQLDTSTSLAAQFQSYCELLLYSWLLL